MGWVEKLATLLSVAPQRPVEVAGRVATLLESTWDRFWAHPPEAEAVSADEALTALASKLASTGADAERRASELHVVDDWVSNALGNLPSGEPISFSHCATRSLARCAYLTCRMLRPRAVVETGVAYGVTTSYILHALEQNAAGSLFSIDLPPLGDESGDHVGRLVPERLRDRWTLVRGKSRQVLSGLLDELGSLDVFVHDSLHTYRTMTWEFRTVWPFLERRGVLLADDIERNRAFHDFVQSVRPSFSCIARASASDGRFGVIVK